MNTKHIVIGLLFAASGCAGTSTATRSGGAGMCSIEDTRWPAAARDFDRTTTLNAIGTLNAAATEDRDQMKRGDRSAVGKKLDAVANEKPGNGFIANDVAELATRLRQLDCSVRSGMAAETAEQRYNQILAELKVEKNILDPSAGSEITQSRAVK